MEQKIDILIYNSSKLISLAGTPRPRIGKEMKDLAIIENGALAANNGQIVEVGASARLLKKYPNVLHKIDATGNLVMPGFVDCHTHLVFAGSRENEYTMKLNGASYLDILEAGGGILSTVKATREISFDELKKISIQKLSRMIELGTTTVEIKSGYGLNYETEKKIFNVIDSIKKETAAEIVPTFLGAHVVPKDIGRREYINWLINEAIPSFKDKAEFCDVFSEQGAFTLEEAREILSVAKRNGYKLKIHSGQFNDIKATGLAAELGAFSADHLEAVSSDQLDLMKKHGTIAVLMPGVTFFLMTQNYVNARGLIANGNAVALATDFNPGSCPSYSMQMMIALACYQLKMSPEEAITAATINAAYAINRGNLVGSLEPGKRADILIMKIKEPAEIPYYFGANLVDRVIVKGGIIVPTK